ncbi:MAG: TraK family protein [Rhodoferax sp.]
MSETLDFLLQKYGPTLTLEELAEVLKRKPGGLRAVLSTRTETWANELNSRKVYVGRRVHFPTKTVADLLTGELAIKGESIKPSIDDLAELLTQCEDTGSNKTSTMAAFLAVCNDVQEAIKVGFSVKTIWEHMREKNRISCGYETFLKYVNWHIKQAPAKQNQVSQKPKKEE